MTENQPTSGREKTNLHLSGVERFFPEDEIIVSKTDLKGRITYVNRTFSKVAGFSPKEALGAPHSIIRHPDMPRCVFKLLWDTISAGNEIFAYVVNRSKNGDHYWVLAHVTPTYDAAGNMTNGIDVDSHWSVEETIIPLYRALCEEESKHANAKEGMAASFQMVVDLLTEKGVSYDELFFSL